MAQAVDDRALHVADHHEALLVDPVLHDPELLFGSDVDKPEVMAAHRLRTHAARARHIHGEGRLRHHAVQFERCAVRQKIRCCADEFACDQVRTVDMLGGPAEFKGHEVVQTGLQSRHHASLQGLVHEIA